MQETLDQHDKDCDGLDRHIYEYMDKNKLPLSVIGDVASDYLLTLFYSFDLNKEARLKFYEYIEKRFIMYLEEMKNIKIH